MSTEQIEAKLIPLDQVYPDPRQPRHLLPPDLAQALVTGASPREILTQLRVRSAHDQWMRERLAELDALAGSIGEDGLMQPIRVIRDGEDHYRIEAGERRWWAHHILVQRGKEQFQNIVAFVVEKESTSSGLLRRRVAENVQRSGFTALELAQAMASRIRELMSAEPGIRRNEAERRVGKENNMTDRRVRQYLALLTLSPEAQELAQQAHLTESSLRPIVSIKDAAGQLVAVRGLLHPPQKKTVARHLPRSPKRRRLSSKSSRSPRERKPRGGIFKAASRHKTEARNPRNAHRRISTESETARIIRRILILARSLKDTDCRKLKTAPWTEVLKTERDLRSLVNLRDALDIALKSAIHTNQE